MTGRSRTSLLGIVASLAIGALVILAGSDGSAEVGGITTLMANDPDSLGYNSENNRRMIGQSYYHMFEICTLLGRDAEPFDLQFTTPDGEEVDSGKFEYG